MEKFQKINYEASVQQHDSKWYARIEIFINGELANDLRSRESFVTKDAAELAMRELIEIIKTTHNLQTIH